MDESSEQLAAAHSRKLCTYEPLMEVLRTYLDLGWQVEILPWVAVVRGLMNSTSIKRIHDFLLLPRQRWQ